MSDVIGPPEAENLSDYLGITEMVPPYHWLEWCSWCGRKHRMSIGPCASCGGAYGVVQPVSERVQEQCGRTYRCDGCHEYEQHLRG